MGETTQTGTSLKSLLNDTRFRGYASQVIALALLIAAVVYGLYNIVQNLEKAGVTTGFGFLWEASGFDISQTLIPYTSSSTYFDALIVGLLNTLTVSVLGIFFSTFLGLFLGVIRLSPNWLISRMAGAYTEMIRNVPLLLQVLFWYLAILTPLPGPRQALDLGGVIFLSNRGLQAPWPTFESGFVYTGIAIVVAIVASIAVIWWGRKRQEETGDRFPVYLTSCGLVLVLPLAVYLLSGSPITWDVPVMRGFNFRGGANILPELIALTLALTLYSATFIGEYIRAGIMAVNKGQKEAAYALGHRPGLTYRLIIIPQAMRLATPPLIGQYLTLVKNSSLAVVIGYPDLVHVFAGTALNQSGQSVEIITITMAVYLGLSLIISLFMNWYNRKYALRGN